MAEAGHYPKLPSRNVKVAGRTGIANCEMMLANMKEGGMISAHDYKVAKAAATALCGGDIETGSLVDEEWLLTIERRQFVELLLSGYGALACYLVFKFCERIIVDWLSGFE